MTGRVAVRKGYWYLVVSYKDADGEFRQHWKKTDLKERGNKKLAEKQLADFMTDFALKQKEEEQKQLFTRRLSTQKDAEATRRMPFGEYIMQYVQEILPKLTLGVQTEYISRAKVINDYFAPKKKRLMDITTADIIEYFDYLRKEKHIKEISIKHYAVVIRPALRKAYQDKIIPENPFDFVPPIHRERFHPTFYNKDEMQLFFNAIKGHPMELEYKLLAYYGLRRSELLGIKWDAIDYENGILYIRKTLLCPKKTLIVSDKMKTATSNRTLPLIPEIVELLKAREERIRLDREYFGKGYKKDFIGFVCVNTVGGIILPDHVSNTFEKILKRNNLKKIRLHDLRHSCASIMLANGVQMKQIQEWLGHSNYSTTADVYSHLDFSSKQASAKTISEVLSFDEKKEETKEDILKQIEELQKKLSKM